MKDIVYSKSKYIKGTPRKARLLVDLVRGKNALEAVDILKFTNKKAAGDVLKTLESGIANCVNNNNWEKQNIVIAEARVDEAPVLKRFRAVSKGRAHRIIKRNSHIILGFKLNQ